MDRNRPVPAEVQSGVMSWGEWRSCRSKVRWWTRADAKKHTRLMRRRYGHKLSEYHCDICDGYHVTKQVNPLPQETPDGRPQAHP